MSFKASKIDIDLTLDLTEFIPEANGGILTCEEIDGKKIFEWNKFAVGEGEKLKNLEKKFRANDKEAPTMVELTEKSRESVVRQIDFFYGMGIPFYEKLHMQTLQEILTYINEQVSPVKKKSPKSKK